MASSSSSPTPTRWHVFLSFRGTDTRIGFTSHLHTSLQRAGIRTFIDEPELRAGDVISLELHNAIKQSKIYIVVLSQNYASSGWCLDELAEILERWKSSGRLVLPIFYKIEPSVVRHQISSFKQAFEKHEGRFPMEIVNKWRASLKEVADISGYHLRNEVGALCIKLTDHAASGYELCENRHLRTEADIINEVVERVLQVIKPVTLEVAQHPVGISSRVASLKSLLDSAGTINGVNWIGIHGMGGVGKTTLAKAFFNQMSGSFDGGCFLADIKNICAGSECHVSLQQQLVNDVLKRETTSSTTINNIGQGINLIRQLIVSLKVLVVLDDIDHQDQVKYLVGKFLASGSVIVLTTRNGDLLDKLLVKNKYMADILDADESLQLFNQHAFEDTEIMPELREMSDEILRYAGGLPLALKVFGSSLKGAEKGGWELFIDKLQKLPIEIEVEKKLKISYDALESVHPQLQALFLDIAFFFIGGMWENQDEDAYGNAVAILETYYDGTVNECISVLQKRNLIRIDKYNGIQVMQMHDLIRGMAKKIAGNSRLVRHDDISDVLENKKGTKAIEGMVDLDYDDEDPDDEVYEKYSCDAETFDTMPNLRFLRLYNVNMRGSFGKPFKDLRWLCWTGCDSFPSNFCAKKLVILELRDNNICTFGENALVLEKLKILDMSCSYQLSKTPDFTGLKCLETLNLSKCSRLVEVDVSIGNLERLATLDLCSCKSLTSLPDSICKLRALKSLNLTSCRRLEALPMELGNIESLTHLIIAWHVSISQLPDSLGRLSKLVMLDLHYNSSLQSIPETICNLRSLESLYLTGCPNLKALPMELGNNESLKELKADGLSISQLPDSLGRLSKLVVLDLSKNKDLQSIPNSICNLRSLESLYLTGCPNLKALPMELGNNESLKELKADGLSISRLPGSLGRMIVLKADKLNFEAYDCLQSIRNMRSVESLNISCCHSTQLSNLQLPSTLKQLKAYNFMLLQKLPDLSNLQQLQKMHLSQCSSLRRMDDLDKLISIKELHLEGCTSLERLPDLSNLQQLKKIYLSNCSSLTGIQGVEKVISINELDLRDCASLKRLPNLSDLKQLKTLHHYRCRTLTEIEGLQEVISITELDLRGCISLEILPDLSNLQQLQTLLLKDCFSLIKIQGLETLNRIAVLDLSGCVSLKRLPDLSNLQQLKRLLLKDCSSLIKIQGLETLITIVELDSRGCISLKRVPEVSFLKQLKVLDGRPYCHVDYV